MLNMLCFSNFYIVIDLPLQLHSKGSLIVNYNLACCDYKYFNSKFVTIPLR